jgi:hypothetical protein
MFFVQGDFQVLNNHMTSYAKSVKKKKQRREKKIVYGQEMYDNSIFPNVEICRWQINTTSYIKSS